jgi:hypothetical protein
MMTTHNEARSLPRASYLAHLDRRLALEAVTTVDRARFTEIDLARVRAANILAAALEGRPDEDE